MEFDKDISFKTNVQRVLAESKKDSTELATMGKGRVMYCPKCKLYTNHLFLRLDDSIGKQAIGYSCRVCSSTTAAMERNKFTGEVLKRYVAPGFKI